MIVTSRFYVALVTDRLTLKSKNISRINIRDLSIQAFPFVSAISAG